MGTNENVNNNVNESVEQATQRIEILSELIRDTEESKREALVSNMQDNDNPIIESCEDIDDNIRTHKIAETLGGNVVNAKAQTTESDNAVQNVVAVENDSVQNVQNTQSVQNIQGVQSSVPNTKNAQFIETSKTTGQLNYKEENTQPNNTNISSNNQYNQNNRNNQNNQENQIDGNGNKGNTESDKDQEDADNITKKEKQHSQDKKDFRLERMLFARINTMQGKIKESLELIKKFERINAKEENLPNIVTTLHDKLTQEVIKQFRTVGIEFNMKSYLVQAIVSDLLSQFEEGISEFRDCSENLNFVREVQEDFESRVELAPTSRVKNIFARLRGLFKPERKQEKLEELERERQEKKLEEANIHLIKYKFINNELQRYTIKKNIVHSLTRDILNGQGYGLTLTMEEFIQQRIAPEMKKLGLEANLEQLRQELFNQYSKGQDTISKEEFFGTSVGEIKRNVKLGRVGFIHSKISAVTNASIPESEERLIG